MWVGLDDVGHCQKWVVVVNGWDTFVKRQGFFTRVLPRSFDQKCPRPARDLPGPTLTQPLLRPIVNYLEHFDSLQPSLSAYNLCRLYLTLPTGGGGPSAKSRCTVHNTISFRHLYCPRGYRRMNIALPYCASALAHQRCSTSPYLNPSRLSSTPPLFLPYISPNDLAHPPESLSPA